MKKIYVLDTNVLLNDHYAPLAFDEHIVVVPLVVLEELDNIKMRKADLSRDARAAIRTLEEIIGETDANVQLGINMSDSGVHNCHPDATLIISTMPTCSVDIPNDMADNIIINTALELQTTHTENEVVLVSNDINLRLKAKGGGLTHAQVYKRDIIIEDTDLLPQGHVEVETGWLSDLSDNSKVKSKSCGGMVIPLDEFGEYMPDIGSWFYNEDEDWAAHVDDIVDDESDTMIHATFKKISTMKKRRCSGVQARSIGQAIGIDALLDDTKDVVVLFGAAGSGKTLLATAAATEMVKGKKNFHMDRVIFSKTMDSQFEDMGFLPGNEHEKLAPWAGAVYDNMEVISRITKNLDLHPDQAINGDRAFIELKSLNFMRGRSLSHRILILDEAQNLNVKQMKTLLSRAGENCKVILMGNLAQIDNDYISENSSGLTYICQKFAKWDRASIVHLEGVERSPLAAFVEENFV